MVCEKSKAEGVQSANAGVCVQKRVECDDGTPAKMRVLIYLLGPCLVSTVWLDFEYFRRKVTYRKVHHTRGLLRSMECESRRRVEVLSVWIGTVAAPVQRLLLSGPSIRSRDLNLCRFRYLHCGFV